MVAGAHKSSFPSATSIRVAVICASDTRTLATDIGGALAQDLATQAGFSVSARVLIRDDLDLIRAQVLRFVFGNDQTRQARGIDAVTIANAGSGVAASVDSAAGVNIGSAPPSARDASTRTGANRTGANIDVVGVVDGGGNADVVLVTGGTGVAPRDTTVEAIAPLFDRCLDGFGELFRMLSFAEIGPAAMLSRATAGIIGHAAVFLMPGSPAAVHLAMERLILPDLRHLVAELRRQPDEAEGHDHRRHA